MDELAHILPPTDGTFQEVWHAGPQTINACGQGILDVRLKMDEYFLSEI